MIRITGITKSFEQLQVLKGIDLEIGQGEIVSIVGPSGAGKTTLLQIMGSLDRPDSGTVSYDGTDLFSLSDRKLAQFRNRNIGFVFQFHQLLPEFTMEENVAMPALISGTSRRTAMERARKLIDYLGLSDRRSHKPSQLSGARDSEPPWHARWSTNPKPCWPTSRRGVSTATTAPSSTNSSSICAATSARHS